MSDQPNGPLVNTAAALVIVVIVLPILLTIVCCGLCGIGNVASAFNR